MSDSFDRAILLFIVRRAFMPTDSVIDQEEQHLKNWWNELQRSSTKPKPFNWIVDRMFVELEIRFGHVTNNTAISDWPTRDQITYH